MTKAASNPQRKAGDSGGTAAAAPVAQADSGGAADTPTTLPGPQEDEAAAAPPAPPAVPAKPAAPAQTVVVKGTTGPARLASLAAQVVQEKNGRTDPEAISLLIEACERYGVNPDAKKKPVELLAWRFYPATDEDGVQVPDAVVIVTAGGVKLKHFEDPDWPMDQETEDTLRRIFNAWTYGADKQLIPAPLPTELALPATAVDGKVRDTSHVYAGGYLKSGGKAEADRREQRKQERLKKQGLA